MNFKNKNKYITSRERVLMSLRHEEPDRIPFDLDGTSVTGINIRTYKNFLTYLGIKKKKFKIRNMFQQLAWVHEDILKKLKVDTRTLTPNDPSTWSMSIEDIKDGSKLSTDQYGAVCRMPNNGFYFDFYKAPLAGTKFNELSDYPFPDPKDKKRIEGLDESSKKIHDRGYIVCNPFFYGGFFEAAFWLRGFEQFYCDLASDIKYACYLMDKLLEIEMEYLGFTIDNFGKNIDIIITFNDLGGQNNLLISPLTYRKYIKPRQKKLYSFLKKKKPSIFIFLHCCGAIYDIIPDFIEVGVDILNPIQVSAANMNTKKLKKEFGKDITFWGGGVDTQNILPYGSIKEVKEEVRKRIEDLAPGGGFVFSTVHNIQAGIPPENLIAMWETLQEYGKY